MDLNVTSISLTLLLLWTLSKCYSFYKCYGAAVRTGYPVYISPTLSKSIAWMILGPAFEPQFRKWLPAWMYERLDVSLHGWEFRSKNKMHEKLGKVFVVVTPDEAVMWAADPVVGNQVLQKRKEYQQSAVTEKIIGLLGSNVLIANGDDWQRQRRTLAPIFNERISDSVWREGCRQTESMLDYLENHPGGHTLEGLHNIAINVIGCVGYGQSHTWSPEPYKDATNLHKEKLSYFNAIGLITILLLEAAFLPPRFLKMPFMSPAHRLLGRAMEELPGLSKELLDSERQAAKKGSGPRNTLLSMLVRLSDEGKIEGSTGLSLSEDEIRGNLFTFSAAGFDTTANTMGYAVTLLAAYPEWQEWVQEELKNFDVDSSTWNYEATFPNLKRVLAVMFETLRLFTPVLHSTRQIWDDQQITDSEGRSHYLTAPMMVYVSAQSMHLDRTIWGADALSFKPTRWLDATGNIITPAKGTFLPWSGGPRVCPGMKFSQVEFVAVFTTLFRSARCEALRREDETAEQARNRLEGIMANSVSKLTLQVRDPTEVTLRWARA